MAKKTVRVSDVSGEEIEEGKGATVTIRFADARRGALVLDVTDAEAEAMGAKGRPQRPKAEERIRLAVRNGKPAADWMVVAGRLGAGSAAA